MSERLLRNIFIVGTVAFLVILVVMTIDSLNQVTSTRTPQLTDQVVAGKQTWQNKNCNDCHTILGIGGYYAPELTKEFNRRGGAWLKAFLQDPQKVLPGTTMPNEALSEQQAQNLVTFFQWVSQVDTNNWPPQPIAIKAAAPPAAPVNPQPAQPVQNSAPAPSQTAAPTATLSLSGAVVYQDKACSTCHTINGTGGRSGPELSHIASVPYDGLANTPEFLSKYLQNPQGLKSDALMPSIPMTDAEREALVQYLITMK